MLAAVLALFYWMSLAISSSFLKDLGGIPVFAEPPRALSAFLGGAGSFVSPEGWLATTFMHPIVLSMSIVGAFVVASSTGAQELENGTLDLVLSRPIGRSQYLRGRLAAGLLLSTVVQFGTLAGVGVAYATIADVRNLSIARVVVTCLGAVALYGMFTCLAIWVFSAGSQRGRTLSIAIGAVTAAYLINFIALAFEVTSFLSPFTPFRYFRPGAMLNGEEIMLPFTVLPALAMFSALGAVRTFRRRDLTR